MKKLAALGTALVLTFTMGTAIYAAGTNTTCRNASHIHAKASECSYVDEDGDGVCDNCLNNKADCKAHINSNSSKASGCTSGQGHHSTGHGHKNHHR